MTNTNLKTPRRLIYVDASGMNNNSTFKISLYDKGNNSTYILQLQDIAHNNLAEQYAVFYAVLYVKKNNFKKCHILCDNQSAVQQEIIKRLSKKYAIGISWIPREANIIADKISKLEPTKKEEEWNLLKLFVDLITEQGEHLNTSTKTSSTSTHSIHEELEKMKERLKTKNTKISNQAQQINSLKEKIKK